MKKSIYLFSVISMVFLMTSTDLSAQEFEIPQSATVEKDGTTVVKRVITNGFWSNWSLTGAIGTQFYYGENEKYMKFKDMWSFPTVDIYLNKWVTPAFGWGLGFGGYRFKGITHAEIFAPYSAFRTDDVYGTFNGKDYYWQKGAWFNPFLYFTFDLASIFNGYKENRFWEPQIYAGGGIAIAADDQVGRTAPSFNAGFINNFRITDRLSLVLNLRGALVGDEIDGESRSNEPTIKNIRRNIPLDGAFGASFGVRVKFGERRHQTFESLAVYENVIVEQKEEISRLANETQTMAAQQKALQEKRAETQAELDETKAELNAVLAQSRQKELSFSYHINFDLDKTNLTNRELIDLQLIAEVMKQDESRVFYLIGYADRQTGSKSHNTWLSEQRANKVYDCLTKKYGVNPAQLIKSHQGGVDTMFLKDNMLSRCVMIISKASGE